MSLKRLLWMQSATLHASESESAGIALTMMTGDLSRRAETA